MSDKAANDKILDPKVLDPKAFDLGTIDDRVDTLEARLAFQDDAIETLNKTITEQWAKIDALTRQIALLGERLSEAESQPRPTNEPPPHY